MNAVEKYNIKSDASIPQIDDKYFEYPYRVEVNHYYWYIMRHRKFLWWKFWWMSFAIERR